MDRQRLHESVLIAEGQQMVLLGVSYLPLAIGGVVTGALTIWYFNPRYMVEINKVAPKRPEAESRLEMARTL